jgi:hypothetical protein
MFSQNKKFSFALERSDFEKSIFCGVDSYEVMNPDMCNGFIVNKMGIKFHKTGKFKNMPYKNEHELLTNYQKNYITGTNKIKVEYIMARHKWGRVQPIGSLSLSLFHRPTRHSICEDTYEDYDMVNCQPSVINQICLQHGIENKQCMAYCENPKEWRHTVAKQHHLKPIFNKDTGVTLSPYEQAKKLFISLAFGGSYAVWQKDYNAEGGDISEVIEIEKELSDVMDLIYKKNVDMIDDVCNETWKKKSTQAKKRSIMGLWAQSIERLLQECCVLKICSDFGFKLNSIVPCQDGFMLLKSLLKPDLNILEVMQNHIFEIFGFNIKWEVKPFDEQLSCGIPLVPLISELNEDFSLKTVTAKFEKTHCKITNIGMFVKTEDNGDIVMTKSHLITSYEHMTYEAVVKGEKTQLNFIAKWLHNNPYIRVKREIQIIPPDLKVPDDVYNAWRSFKMLNIKTYIPKPDAIELICNHIKILCNHDEYCYEYFIKWIACMIQFPSQKLPMPVFVSREGGGKGSLLRLFSNILGSSKILQTQEPSKEVWGEFNSLMLNSYLVCLDEISKKEMTGCEGKIKGLITEPTIRINDKGKSRFEVPSYHKFIAFANPDAYGNEPMNTTDGDRRKWFVKCSDNLVKNKPYFNKFYKTLDDIDSMKTVFEFFNTFVDAKGVLSMDLPVTEYNQSLKDMAVPPLKLFITDFMSTNFKKAITTVELFEKLKEWTSRTGIRYECNYLQFGCRLSNLEIIGMEKSSDIGELRLKGWSFDIDKCKESLGLEKPKCLIKCEEEDEDDGFGV